MDTRPKYETREDSFNEGGIIKFVSNKWNVNFSKLPISYKLDYAMYRNKSLMGFCEVKRRKYRQSDFNTYMISLDKVIQAKLLATTTKTKSVLIVSWIDKMGWIDLRDKFVCNEGGRRDRNDWQDVEPVCHFRIDRFRDIKMSDGLIKI